MAWRRWSLSTDVRKPLKGGERCAAAAAAADRGAKKLRLRVHRASERATFDESRWLVPSFARSFSFLSVEDSQRGCQSALLLRHSNSEVPIQRSDGRSAGLAVGRANGRRRRSPVARSVHHPQLRGYKIQFDGLAWPFANLTIGNGAEEEGRRMKSSL